MSPLSPSSRERGRERRAKGGERGEGRGKREQSTSTRQVKRRTMLPNEPARSLKLDAVHLCAAL